MLFVGCVVCFNNKNKHTHFVLVHLPLKLHTNQCYILSPNQPFIYLSSFDDTVVVLTVIWSMYIGSQQLIFKFNIAEFCKDEANLSFTFHQTNNTTSTSQLSFSLLNFHFTTLLVFHSLSSLSCFCKSNQCLFSFLVYFSANDDFLWNSGKNRKIPSVSRKRGGTSSNTKNIISAISK